MTNDTELEKARQWRANYYDQHDSLLRKRLFGMEFVVEPKVFDRVLADYACIVQRKTVQECCKAVCSSCNGDTPEWNQSVELGSTGWEHKHIDGLSSWYCRAVAIRAKFVEVLR